ncbi:hypothetical protein [Ranid herpesvirus 3]|uniref:Uncharacterized protein n=1 Tax=Ranid herpesvirus 3 TaxID=1987509 RepID=A0A1X9T5G0_9VIRU|nr:hypothetical protein [Ranid herpesvirus 3]ARR28885.1 hypothetical protein [Ranid herpesvirus 3]
MGIHKNLVQGMIMHSLINPENGAFELLDQTVNDYSVLVFDHTLMMHKALCACDADVNSVEELRSKCLTYLCQMYGKYGLKRTSTIILTVDSMKFPLKVTAHTNRKKNKLSDRIHSVIAQKNSLTVELINTLHEKFGSAFIAIEGVTTLTPRYTYECVPENHPIANYVVRKIGTEVEADLIQVFCAVDIAEKFPNESVAMVAFDSDIPIIMSAVYCKQLGHIPSNCHVIFGCPKLAVNMADHVSGLMIKMSYLKSYPRERLPGIHAFNRLLDVFSIKFLPMPYYKAVSILFDQYAKDETTLRNFTKAFEKVGFRGPAFMYCLTAYMGENDAFMGNVNCVAAFQHAAEQGELPQDFVTKLSHKKGCRLFMDLYRNGMLPFGTHQLYLKAYLRSYFVLKPCASLSRASFAVVAAVVGGCDYSIPLHNCGTSQLLKILCTGDRPDVNYVAEPNLFTEEALNRIFVQPSVTLIGKSVDFVPLWTAMTKIVQHVLRGWVEPGYFMSLSKRVFAGENDCYILRNYQMDFTLTNDYLSDVKKRIKRCYNANCQKKNKRLRPYDTARILKHTL